MVSASAANAEQVLNQNDIEGNKDKDPRVPCVASIVGAFVELDVQRLKLMQRIGAAAPLLVEQFEAKAFLKFEKAF